MENKFEQFFEETAFDIHEPHSSHFDRFERRLHTNQKQRTPWKWLSVAASVVLLVGFWMGSNHQQEQLGLSNVSPKMAEAQNYFIATIKQELKEVEKHRNLSTEKVIEQAIDQLEELEDNYNMLTTELSKNGYEKRLILAMVNNYQERLAILQNVLEQIEKIKNINNTNNEELYI